jgi:hypothetical protein
MKFIPTVCATMVVLLAVSTPSFAQQKTIKACTEEWRANKAANQANGVTEKAYVAQCRVGGASAQPTPVPASPAPAPAPTTRTAPQRTPAPSPTATAPTPRQPPPAPSPVPSPAAPTPAVNQFQAEAQAKARCPADTVVWVNVPSHIYHFAGTHNYGNTKSGAYMCEGDTVAAGYRASKTERHP